MFPVPLPVRQIHLGQLRVVPVHQYIFAVTFLCHLGVVKAALLHGMAIYDDNLVVGNGVLGINPSGKQVATE